MLLFAVMQPETAVVVGLLVFGVAFALSAPAQRSRSTARIARWTALAVVVAYVMVNAVPVLLLFSRYFFRALLPLFPEPYDVRWWLYVAPLAAAAVSIAVALVGIARRRSAPQVPVVPIVRRGWASFSSRPDLAVAGIPLVLLVLTSVFAGAVSSADPNGWYAVTLRPGGEGALNAAMSTFFGWAYGIPVLLAALVLALVTCAMLRANAARPYARPDTVDAETADRRLLSSAVLRVCAGAALMALGGAWTMIGASGMSGVGLQIVGSTEVIYPTGFSSFAPAFIVLGWVAQVAAIALLLHVASGRRLSLQRRRSVTVSATA